jgi:hypothetical protein
VIQVCWTFLALLFTPQTYLSNLRSPTPLSWGRAFFATLILFQVWAVEAFDAEGKPVPSRDN